MKEDSGRIALVDDVVRYTSETWDLLDGVLASELARAFQPQPTVIASELATFRRHLRQKSPGATDDSDSRRCARMSQNNAATAIGFSDHE